MLSSLLLQVFYVNVRGRLLPYGNTEVRRLPYGKKQFTITVAR